MRIAAFPALLAAAALPMIGASAALAQSNTISILQEGGGNTLTVDQSGASGSTVGGLTINAATERQDGLSITSAGPLMQPVLDGNGDPVLDSDGNVVMESAMGSAEALVPSFSRTDPGLARQSGRNNRADVRITGTGGFVGLLQGNDNSGLGNSADVALNGNGSALVGQEGGGNEADLSVDGPDAFGSILQRGDGNSGTLVVSGADASGSISQLGSDNESSLSVSGVDGASVAYVLQGNGITNFNPTQGVEVTTNAASVTITQTQMSGF